MIILSLAGLLFIVAGFIIVLVYTNAGALPVFLIGLGIIITLSGTITTFVMNHESKEKLNEKIVNKDERTYEVLEVIILKNEEVQVILKDKENEKIEIGEFEIKYKDEKLKPFKKDNVIYLPKDYFKK